ncbi:hypothetical protein [Halobacillus sp. A5]|uniref:hypothetical protein n=1 Tax=Halobacillus sp. A5 TaxID=2880263 RepID=UPI0020A6CAFB|nr:hypothetical protein [Halobacillus sp. A5]MCP3027372.1 hypothetical protein [Halobacillus sp. A5]
MFKVLLLTAGLIGIYTLIKEEKPTLRYSVMTYFVLLTIIFTVGHFYISSSYNLSSRPLEGGFSALFDWVAAFKYFFVLPLIMLFVFKLYKWPLQSTNTPVVKGILLWRRLHFLIYVRSYILRFRSIKKDFQT